jgi:hypothetical protein
MKHSISGSALLVGAWVFVISACKGELPATEQLPATGQTNAHQANKNDGIPGTVTVADDGTLRSGALLRYKKLKDGTIADLNTGLIWEVKCESGCGLHAYDTGYRWSGDGSQETIWDWLDDINAEGGRGYAGHSDWRIPNVRELQSIVDYGQDDPSIDAIFGPTPVDSYWSSTTVVTPGPIDGWVVHFSIGSVYPDFKSNVHCVRAVRGGL